MDDLDAPPFAPTVAIEVLSPGDSQADVLGKVDVYLRRGTLLVIVMDPLLRTAMLHDATGVVQLSGDDTLRHSALDGFALRIDTFFASALDITQP